MARQQKIDLMVVEGDELFRALLGAVGNRCEMTTVLCESAQEALEILNTCVVKAIITEAHLPSISGFEFIETLRLQLDYAPLLVITSSENSREYRVKASNAGADHFLSKPVNVNELSEVILKVKARSH